MRFKNTQFNFKIMSLTFVKLIFFFFFSINKIDVNRSYCLFMISEELKFKLSSLIITVPFESYFSKL